MNFRRITSSPAGRSRRGVVRVLAGGLTLLATGRAVAAPGAADPRAAKDKKKGRKKPKFRTITKTFSNDSLINLSDQGAANLYPSPIQISGFKQGKVLDVNVTLKNLSHEDPSDLNLLLQAPGGRRAIILSDAGDAFNVNGLTLTLDDQAATGLPFASPLSAGSFKPTNFGPLGSDDFPPPAPAGESANIALSTFNGINPNGTWRLFVHDDAAEGSGSIGGWSLTIKARVRK